MNSVAFQGYFAFESAIARVAAHRRARPLGAGTTQAELLLKIDPHPATRVHRKRVLRCYSRYAIRGVSVVQQTANRMPPVHSPFDELVFDLLAMLLPQFIREKESDD
jgi:hypothetical protein